MILSDRGAQLWKLSFGCGWLCFPNYSFPFLLLHHRSPHSLSLSVFLLPCTGTGQVLLGRTAVWTQPDREWCPGTWRFVPGCWAGWNAAGAAEIHQFEPGHGTPRTQSWLQEFLLEDFHILLARLIIAVRIWPLIPPPKAPSLFLNSPILIKTLTLEIEDCTYKIKLWWNYEKNLTFYWVNLSLQ